MNATQKALWALAGLKIMDGLEGINGFHLTGANRIRARLSRQNRAYRAYRAYWCSSCDREKVRASMTCSDCGKKDGSTQRMKKGDNF